ncbi:optineurin isoform X3 [Homalodisca vitripennis]|uniref:optineurin isoform X3 n=1 Tax=Homalodisca vitripennis TaxID=197043 RepID=UPI001EECCE17|nr:optineurin isoform X3 [Homalodisca vitripennis]
MPIVSGSTDLKSLPSMNGNSDHSLLQLDDDESFVVLERSSANDEGMTIDGNLQGYQPLPVSYSFPVFNNLVSSQSPLINQPVPVIDPLGLQFESPHSSVSVEEIEKRLQEVIHENINLKEIVYQTNMVMKQQLKTVSLVQDRALETQRNHQEKFEETKSLILKLGSEKNILQETNSLIVSQLEKLKEENKELKSANEAFGNEISKFKEDTKQLKESNMALVTETTKLLAENEALKKQLTTAQEAVQTASESSKVSSSELMAENETLKNRLASAEALQRSFENSKIAELMEETQNLKKQLESANEAYQNAWESGKVAAAELVAENKSLKNQLVSAEEALKHASEGNKKASQQSAKEVELHQLVGDLTRKLEIVERARRDQEFGLDRLQAQLGRVTEELTDTQRKLAHSENALQSSQSQLQTENSFQYGEKLNKYLGLLKQLKDSLDEEQSRCNSLGSWLNLTAESGNVMEFEISELRRLLQEEQEHSVKMKTCLYSAVTMIHEILSDFKSLGEELEKVRADHAVKESHSLAYDEMQKKGFRERLDSLTAKLVEKEEALAISQRHLASLHEAVRLQNAEKEGSGEVKVLKEQVKNLSDEVQAKKDELQANMQQIQTLRTEVQKLQGVNDTVMVLEEQAKIYQADFEAERKARELLVAEKERVVEDFRHLVKRNEALLKQVNKLQNNLPRENAVTSQTCSSSRRQEQTPSPPTPRPQDDVIPAPKRYFCPNPECNMIFTTVDPLQLHVITCLKLDD